MIKLYINTKCGHCNVARQYLLDKDIKFKEIDISTLDKDEINKLREKRILSVPAFEINDEIVIGLNKDKINNLLKKYIK